MHLQRKCHPELAAIAQSLSLSPKQKYVLETGLVYQCQKQKLLDVFPPCILLYYTNNGKNNNDSIELNKKLLFLQIVGRVTVYIHLVLK